MSHVRCPSDSRGYPGGPDEPWDDTICSEPIAFVGFTRRTQDPKLAWLEARLTEAGIAHRRNGHTWHAPILEVDAGRIDSAWEMLDPIDDIPDDDNMFT